jgi:IS5 family transposase
MKPKPSPATTQPDFFQIELKSIINLSHPLVKLAEEFNWDEFEQQLQPTYAPVIGALGINTRLMVALHFLKHHQDLSDEAIVARWMESPYWQFFSGMQFFSHQPPIDSSSMTRWRTRLGRAGASWGEPVPSLCSRPRASLFSSRSFRSVVRRAPL